MKVPKLAVAKPKKLGMKKVGMLKNSSVKSWVPKSPMNKSMKKFKLQGGY